MTEKRAYFAVCWRNDEGASYEGAPKFTTRAAAQREADFRNRVRPEGSTAHHFVRAFVESEGEP